MLNSASTSFTVGNLFSPMHSEYFKFHPHDLYAFSMDAFKTAGIAADMDQLALKISFSLSICSWTDTSSWNQNGLICNNLVFLGFVPYTVTLASLPNRFLYSPLAGSITIKGRASRCNSSSILKIVLDFPEPFVPATKVCEAKLCKSSKTGCPVLLLMCWISPILTSEPLERNDFLTTSMPKEAWFATLTPNMDFFGKDICLDSSLLLRSIAVEKVFSFDSASKVGWTKCSRAFRIASTPFSFVHVLMLMGCSLSP